MRKIKFRAWNPRSKVMRLWKSLKFETLDFLDHQQMLGGQYKLMQYTGLKDKNGKEIYGGDIVCGENAFGNKFTVDLENYGVMGHLQEFSTKDYEIIGNIYENPELLTKSSELI